MSDRIRGHDIFQASEAVEGDDGLWITIIKEGRSQNNRNYKRSALEKAVNDRVYENVRMFVDHSENLPLKRSVKELVSGIGETKLDTSFPDGLARVRGKVTWFNEEFQKFADKAKTHIGVSHDALLKGVRSVRDGRRYEDIDEIRQAHSVDWVIYPSAGGGFEQFYAQEGVEMTEAIDWDAIDEDMLKEHKPDLYAALTTRSKESKEGDEGDEDDDKKVPNPDPDGSPGGGQLTERGIESIVMRVFERVEARKSTQEEVAGKVKSLVNGSTLPDVTKARLIRSFEGVESFDEKRVKDSIEEAKNELAAVAGPRIRQMGPSGDSGSQQSASLGRAHEAVASAFGMKPASKKDEEND